MPILVAVFIAAVFVVIIHDVPIEEEEWQKLL